MLLADIERSNRELWLLLTKFLLLSGLRVGEAVALTKKDIDKDSVLFLQPCTRLQKRRYLF